MTLGSWGEFPPEGGLLPDAEITEELGAEKKDAESPGRLSCGQLQGNCSNPGEPVGESRSDLSALYLSLICFGRDLAGK